MDKAGLSDEYLQVLSMRGIKDKQLDEFLRRYYGNDVDIVQARKNWLEMAKAGQVINEGSGWARMMPTASRSTT